jgi:rsbT co-antagonist protein RsbR
VAAPGTELSLTAEELERRRRMVSLSDEDVERIKHVGDRFRGRVGELTDAFFGHLARFSEAEPLLANSELLSQVKELKRAHLEAMFEGDWGPRYAQQRVALGQLYGRAGLPPRLFLGAYRALLEKLRTMTDDQQTFRSLVKLAFFDIGIIVDVLISSRETVIRRQEEAIAELSTPVLQLRDWLLLLPVIGSVDTARARQLTESLLHSIQRTRARAVVMDVTGVVNVDTKVAHHLFQAVSAARLMGVRVIVSGLSAEVSQAMSILGLDVRGLETAGDLQSAVERAEQHLAIRAA